MPTNPNTRSSTPMPCTGKKENPPSTAEQLDLTTSRLSSVALRSPEKVDPAQDAATARKELFAMLANNPKAHKDEATRELFAHKLADYVRLAEHIDDTDIVFEMAKTHFGLVKFQIVLVGNADVGKSSYVKRLSKGNFIVEKYEPTRGADVTHVVIPTTSGPILFEFWDVAGVDLNGGLKDAYYIGAHGAILMYELSQKTSYAALADKYKDLQRVVEDIPTVVVANKDDIKKPSSQKWKSLKFQRQNRLPTPYEVSVKSGKGVEKPLLYLARQLTADNRLRFVAAGAKKLESKSTEEAAKPATKGYPTNEQAGKEAVAEAAAVPLPSSNDKGEF